MIAVAVGVLLGFAAGVAVGLFVRVSRAYDRGVCAGQALEANAHGHAASVREPRRISRQRGRDWHLVDRQMPVVKQYPS